jgi:hypothetical protein
VTVGEEPFNDAAIPGLFFEARIPFEDFEALLEKNPEGWIHEWLVKPPPYASHQLVRLPTAEVGTPIRFDVEGPVRHIALWGVTVL